MKRTFHRIGYEEMRVLEKQDKRTCGYLRVPEVDQKQKYFRGKCAITGERCYQKTSLYTTECQVYQDNIPKGLLKRLYPDFA
jgi:hypothetical protein